MRFTRTLPAVAVVLAAVLGTPPARADANGYLGFIRDHHINVGIASPAKQLWMGNTVCQEMHEGMNRDQVIATSGNWLFDLNGIIDAAQHELCPDTLGAGR